MKSELVAERTVDLAIGAVRFTLARHDDGHYSGVAVLTHSGRRIGLLTAGPLVHGAAQPGSTAVDGAIAGPEVADELERLLAGTLPSEWRQIGVPPADLEALPAQPGL